MNDEKEMTVLSSSASADDVQLPNAISVNKTTDDADRKAFEENQRKMMREMICENDPTRLHPVSMAQLLDTVYQTSPPLIDGLLYPGTYLFAGAPKVGKSFLVAQIAYHVSTGTQFGNYPVREGIVLYLALEDDFSRLQKRLYQMYGTAASTENLYLAVTANQLGGGLDEQLQTFLWDHPDTKLIIIDTLQRIRDAVSTSYSYANDYDIIARLKLFADRSGVCLMIVHHTRKQQSDDPYDMISGTNGLLGAADGAFVLRKKNRTSNDATLDVVGRDQPDQRLYLKRSPAKLTWDIDRVDAELWKLPPDPILELIASHVTYDAPDWQGSPTDLVTLLDVDTKPNALTMKLNVCASRLLNEYGISYKSSRHHDGRRITLHREQPTK